MTDNPYASPVAPVRDALDAIADRPVPAASTEGNVRVKLTLLVLCALFANESFACSCIKPDMSYMEKRAELVVLAQLKERSPSIGKTKYVFATIKSFKGVVGER